jgi:glycosyltransferase involved in cell wall biosynthesis
MKISVVIPTHNRRDWLLLTLRSVLRQHHRDLEAIVVDDGSTDDTVAVLARVPDRRLRVIRHDAPLGLAASRNDGIAEAHGEWVAFVDDDDVWAPDKLASQMGASVATGRSWSYVGTVQIDEQSRVIDGRPPLSPDDVTRLISRYNAIPGGGSNVMVRRDELDRVGPFDVRLKSMEDWEMWIRLNERGAPAWVPRPLLGKREHFGMMSFDVAAIFESVSLIERRPGTRVDRGALHRWVAEMCLRDGHRARALEHFAVAAVRGQAFGVAADVTTIVKRRVSRRLPPSAVTASLDAAWIEAARPWVDELLSRHRGGGENDGLG